MLSIWTRLTARLAWGRVSAALGLSIAITLLTTLGFSALGGPQTLTVVQAHSEYVRYRVFNANLASFLTDGMRIGLADDASLEGLCASGTLTPQVDSVVEYIRQARSALIVTISAGGTLGTGATFAGMISLVADTTCPGKPPATLPVWGPGQVGDTFTVRSEGIGPMLLSGTLEVFGRTIDLGWLGSGGALYAASSQPMTIPPGGWIWSNGAERGDAQVPPEESAFFGYVNSAADTGLDVRLTTETPLLQIIAPGGRLEPSRVEIGLFAQALSDPNILRAQLSLLIFFLLFPIMIDLVGLATSRSKDDD